MTPSDREVGLRPRRAGTAVAARRRWLGPTRAAVSLGALLLAWHLVAASGRYSDVLVPGLGRVAATFWELLISGVLLENVAITLVRLLVGYAVGATLGIAAGLAMARWRFLGEVGLPIVAVLLPVPALAVVPLFTLWFGLGSAPTILLVIIVTAPVVVANTWSGIRTAEPVLLRAGSAMGLDGLRLFGRVVFPAALPSVLTGLRFGLSIAWRAVIAGELVSAAEGGLGFMLFDARDWMRPDIMFATLIVMAMIGLVVEKVAFSAVERATVVRWGMVNG